MRTVKRKSFYVLIGEPHMTTDSLKSPLSRLRQLFERAPLDCDYVLEILGENLGFPASEKHISLLVKRQKRLDSDIGAWSEFIDFSRGDEASLATAEAILALVNFADRSDVKSSIKRACRYLIQSRHIEGGWDDLSAGNIVNDATGCAIAALSEVRKRNICAVPDETLEGAVAYLITQQNDDGGWGVVRNQQSKMHYTYFALWGLAYCKELTVGALKDNVAEALKNGIKWIETNSSQNNNEGISLSLKSPPSPNATALAILSLLETGNGDKIKKDWVNFIKKNRQNGYWEEKSDSSLAHGVRRTYDFMGIPQIIEALARSGEPLDSVTIRKGLQELRKYELASGGFVRNIGHKNPVIWFTSWSLRMMFFLRRELSKDLRIHVDRSVKKVGELERKVESYERERKPENRFITAFGLSNLVLVSIITYLLYSITSPSYGKLLWYSFLLISLLILEIATASYWHKMDKLSKFRSFTLALTFSAINIFLGLI